jgi:hypothetical protein
LLSTDWSKEKDLSFSPMCSMPRRNRRSGGPLILATLHCFSRRPSMSWWAIAHRLLASMHVLPGFVASRVHNFSNYGAVFACKVVWFFSCYCTLYCTRCWSYFACKIDTITKVWLIMRNFCCNSTNISICATMLITCYFFVVQVKNMLPPPFPFNQRDP